MWFLPHRVLPWACLGSCADRVPHGSGWRTPRTGRDGTTSMPTWVTPYGRCGRRRHCCSSRSSHVRGQSSLLGEWRALPCALRALVNTKWSCRQPLCRPTAGNSRHLQCAVGGGAWWRPCASCASGGAPAGMHLMRRWPGAGAPWHMQLAAGLRHAVAIMRQNLTRRLAVQAAVWAAD